MSKPTAAELIRRTEELLPVIAERAAKTEDLRRVPDETVRDLRDAGLIRVSNPTRYGGYGLDIDTTFEIGWRLGQACGATSWFYTVSQSHNWWMGTASEAAQEEYFASPDVISSSAYAPTGQTKRVDEGWWISGRWPYSSGVDHADWVMLGALDLESKSLYALMVPRADVSIDDDWHVSGLKGTGSKTIVIDEPVFVPRHREMKAGGAPDLKWRDEHERGSYGVPQFEVMPAVLATPLIGIAQGAVTEFADRTQKRVIKRGPNSVSMAEDPGAQFRVAESAAEADAALNIIRTDLRELIAHGAAGDALTPLDRARVWRNQCYVAKLSVSAVNRLFDASGAGALFASSALARMHRDVNAGSHQAAVQWDASAARYGKVRLGVATPELW
ncbi:acyl-CoA dehydrogenase family protein [Streptomyces sp. NPDC058614]|uniref:acyl-CoA dehydrogenase family protein n=1 Tax=Streptomyces sp. NPDC058614 TaxID=3346557 RepID=UPI00365FA5FD